MQADVDDDVETQAAEGRHRSEQALVEAHHVGLEVGAFTAGSQPDAGTAVGGGDPGECVDAEAQPETPERVLDGGSDARLPRPWRPVEHDHVAGPARRERAAESAAQLRNSRNATEFPSDSNAVALRLVPIASTRACSMPRQTAWQMSGTTSP